ncbi:MAG TPA: acyltransferase [Gaiellaceae bacterium]|nr:acyltransferase [Gaiellaceae bacterium]
MSLLQRFWGNIPVSPQTRGRKVFGAVGRRWLHAVARYAPLTPAMRASLHRTRGVHVGKRVFIGTEVFIDDAVPSSVTLEDDVTVIAQTTILGHTYYPTHFHRLLGDEETRAGKHTTIRRGAYLGLRSTVLAGVEVGEYAIVGAGSLVTGDVPAYTMVVGVPAKVVREYGPDDVG